MYVVPKYDVKYTLTKNAGAFVMSALNMNKCLCTLYVVFKGGLLVKIKIFTFICTS